MSDLFSNLQHHSPDSPQILAPGLTLIKGLAAKFRLMQHIQHITKKAPFRHMMTPMGHPTKVAMSNCGPLGWVSSQQGYGYSAFDPLSSSSWPAMPTDFKSLAHEAASIAGIQDFQTDSCLINQYHIGDSLGRHQDKDEANFNWPIVSVSLGLDAVFQIFSKQGSTKPHNILLQDGDVLVMHGPARLCFHGIKAIKADALQPNLQHRYNLTFRRAH